MTIDAEINGDEIKGQADTPTGIYVLEGVRTK